MEEIRARVASIVKDPVTAEALKPYYDPLCKRPCFHDEYLDTFNRPNVQLVDTDGKGVERITPNGVVVNGKEYEVDCLVYASGFEVAGDYTRKLGFDIRGRGGRSLGEAWADGPSTLHGVTTRGYPNLLMIGLTQSSWAINFVHILGELARHAAYLVEQSLKRGVEAIEPTQEAQDQWWGTILASLQHRGIAFGGTECTPGYINNEGLKPHPSMIRSAGYAGGTLGFIDILENWRKSNELSGLELTRGGGNP
jgi:cation diffusion facilitator CzcD-associated flavoprotein CzcO